MKQTQKDGHAPAQAPNIVFIMADQLGANSLGCYGSGIDSTPTLDRLAAGGTRYDRCYATCPICAPNRAVFLTGRSPVVNGMIANNFALANDLPTYAHVLQTAGYRTGGFGKFHQTPMHFPEPSDLAFLGFDEAVVCEDTKWTWYEWVKREHPQHAEQALAMCWNFWPCHPPHPESGRVEAMRRKYGSDPRSPWWAMGASKLPPEIHDTTYITGLGLDFMRRHRSEHPEQPFLCHISYVDPHDPYDPPEPYASMFKPEDMPDTVPSEWLDQGFETLALSQRFGGFDKLWNRPDVMRQLRAYYHGSLRFLDDQIKRVESFLREEGLWDNTILVFTTDHGEMLGDHGLITKGVKHYDAGIRCPLIVAGGAIPAGVSSRLTCTLDFFPSFCDWAKVPPEYRPPLEGRSFAEPGWDSVAVCFDTVQSVITEDGWRLTRFGQEGKWQMFDLANDPQEQRNLWPDPAFQARRQELLEALTAVLARPGLVPHYRVMPVLDGGKVVVQSDQFQPPMHQFEIGLSPALRRKQS